MRCLSTSRYSPYHIPNQQELEYMKNLGEWWLRQSLKEQKGSTIKIQAPPVKQTLISGTKAGDFGSSVYNGYVYCDLFFEVISNTLIDVTVSQVSIHRSSKMIPT